ncbi:hypothetical protein EV715DRAFT_255876 [Schizophyllum commune]
MASLFRAYNAALLKRPMLTQCLTAAVLFSGGDVLAQQLVEKRGSLHDYTRTARLAFYGGVCFGPPMTLWYQFLNRIKFASPRRAVIYRVWLDQAFLTPSAYRRRLLLQHDEPARGQAVRSPRSRSLCLRPHHHPKLGRLYTRPDHQLFHRPSAIPLRLRGRRQLVLEYTYLSLANQEQAELEAQAAVNTPVALE